MAGGSSLSRKIFMIFAILFLVLFCVMCLLPFIHLLALSFSSKNPASVGEVALWPVDFTFKSYQYVVQKQEFLLGFWVSLQRVVLGTGISMLLTILVAYPLSKENHEFKLRTVYVWFFVFTILFGGGLVPTYMVINAVGIMDSIWALVIPVAMNVFNMVLLLNFYRGLPKAIEESAFIDGASHWTVLWKMYVPLSLPALATLILFTVVSHWNSWFDGFIYISSPKDYPLQTYLQTLVIQSDSKIMMKAAAEVLRTVSDRTAKAAQIFVGTLPVLILYPFLQKYFMAGIVLGSVKE